METSRGHNPTALRKARIGMSANGNFKGHNPTTLRKAKIVFNFGLSECNRVNSIALQSCKNLRLYHQHYAIYNACKSKEEPMKKQLLA